LKLLKKKIVIFIKNWSSVLQSFNSLSQNFSCNLKSIFSFKEHLKAFWQNYQTGLNSGSFFDPCWLKYKDNNPYENVQGEQLTASPEMHGHTAW